MLTRNFRSALPLLVILCVSNAYLFPFSACTIRHYLKRAGYLRNETRRLIKTCCQKCCDYFVCVYSTGLKRFETWPANEARQRLCKKYIFSSNLLIQVVGAKVVTNAKCPGSKCFGFVAMATAEAASKCILHLNKTELHGRIITVERVRTFQCYLLASHAMMSHKQQLIEQRYFLKASPQFSAQWRIVSCFFAFFFVGSIWILQLRIFFINSDV